MVQRTAVISVLVREKQDSNNRTVRGGVRVVRRHGQLALRVRVVRRHGQLALRVQDGARS